MVRISGTTKFLEIQVSKKEEIIEAFDPNGVGQMGRLFGLPFDPDTSEIVLIPVPWDVTVSYASGCSLGPAAILKASPQIDYFIKDIQDAWKLGVSMLPIPEDVFKESKSLRKMSEVYISWLEEGKDQEAAEMKVIPNTVNEGSEKLNIYVRALAEEYIKKGKTVGVIGGDHSTPLGLIRALSEHFSDFGILQIDAHADLRKAYEGFKYSHASIMHNALENKAVSRLVQVGVRDICEEEVEAIKSSKGRIKTFFDEEIKENLFRGVNFKQICDKIISQLPELVYISFDIDGLDPKYCPGTGTPVPGGLEYNEALFLIKRLVKSGRKVIGFDLCEVAPKGTENGFSEDEWDGNVGSRILYQLSALVGVSQGKLSM